MKTNVQLHPETQCSLTLAERIVELSAEELTILQERLAPRDTPGVNQNAKDVVRRVFEAGMLLPQEIAVAAGTHWTKRIESLGLSPFIKLSVKFGSANSGMHTTEPAIGLFLKPEFVQCAADIFAEMRRLANEAARATTIRGQLFPPPALSRLCKSIIREHLDRNTNLRELFGLDKFAEGSSLDLHSYDDLSNDGPPFPWRVIVSLQNREGASHTRREINISLDSLASVAQVLSRR